MPLVGKLGYHPLVQASFYSGAGYTTDISNLSLCTWWGTLCYWSTGTSSPSEWLVLLVPFQAITYIGQVFYVTLLYINSYIDIVNLLIFNSLGKTIPYAYWYFAALNISAAIYLLLSGMAIGTFCYFDTFDPDFK